MHPSVSLLGNHHALAQYLIIFVALCRGAILTRLVAATLRICRDGIFCARTAFGKTAIAAWIIAQRKVNTLVLVHRRQLLDQWQARLAMFLDLPPEQVGSIGGGKIRRTGIVDVAVIQSLRQKNAVQNIVAEYGQVIVDKCHHLSTFTFEQVMRAINAKFIVGHTATPTRKDGHHPIIQMQCG